MYVHSFAPSLCLAELSIAFLSLKLQPAHLERLTGTPSGEGADSKVLLRLQFHDLTHYYPDRVSFFRSILFVSTSYRS